MKARPHSLSAGEALSMVGLKSLGFMPVLVLNFEEK
jgi:hypothetical protein